MAEKYCIGKSSWPELVGSRGEAAAAKIEEENPSVFALVQPDGIPQTADFRCDRVRVFVDSSGFVVRPPVIG
ncbi:hypothetical protein QVD17_17215 [Tagetes erecta]|uniref:Uncharacterized protein n=1 Tax=Tagetes erecta TaxID=13708 RepID=A0AAD8KXZ3_TARER|nr:hypothetical protein QVD17_17215 [Tagetes erecta]